MDLEGRALLTSVAVAVATLWGIDRAVDSWVKDRTDDLAAAVDRASNVVVFEKRADVVPPPRPGPSVLLLGNSHTYALPALKPGHPLRPDPGVTLIDMLAEHVDRNDTTFYRLAYPNFLPFEMLLRVAHLYHLGYEPDVVVIGLTWRNIARDTAPRDQVRRVFRSKGFEQAVEAMISDPVVLDRLRAEAQDHRRRLEEERMQSEADRLDREIAEKLGRHVHLLGKSRGIRTKLYRMLNVAITEGFVTREKDDFQYEVIPSDLAFNRRCLIALLELLAERGARVIVYRAPERSDLPPLISPDGQSELMAELRKVMDRRRFQLLDARGVVPNRYWGWAYDTPDRSHFTEPGHRALGRFLFESAQEIWRP